MLKNFLPSNLLENLDEKKKKSWYAGFRVRITFFGPDRNGFGKDLFETYLQG